MSERDVITKGEATWICDTNRVVGNLYQINFAEARKPPYRIQRHVEAILDIADDGTLAGVELIDNMPPPPKASTHMRRR